MENIRIQDLPEKQRPYERFYYQGAESLSDQELLAIILGNGSRGQSALDLASAILNRFGSKRGIPDLREVSIEELTDLSGIGKSKAIKIKASLEIGKRAYRVLNETKIRLNRPDLVYDHMGPKLEDLDHEELHLIFLDQRKCFIRDLKLSTGSSTGMTLSAKDIFREAIRANAQSIILVHNHPSGDPNPSVEDLDSTMRFAEIGKMIGITLVDHIIIGKGSYVSLLSNPEYSKLFK